MTAADLRAARAAAQGLAQRSTGVAPVDLVRRLLAVQAQDLRAARLALRARGEGFAARDVDAALSEERSLVVAWLGRGTLHLVCAEDHGWLLGLTAPGRMAGSRRRLGQERVTPDEADRAVAIVERALADDGPLTRPQLGERLAARGVRTEGQALPHLLALAALRGISVLGPVRADGHAFALARDWLGPQPPAPSRDAALAELARRNLAAHGPATDADLAGWIGLPLRDARAGLHAISKELIERGDGLVDLAARATASPPAPAPPRLLGAFDPYLLGWRDRSFAVVREHARRVHPGGGMLRAVATAGGAVVGTWTSRRRADRLAIAVEPFAPLDPETERALREDAADVARFEGLDPA